MRQIAVARRRADERPPFRSLANLVESEAVDVDDALGSLHAELHQIDQRRSAGEKAHARALLRGG